MPETSLKSKHLPILHTAVRTPCDMALSKTPHFQTASYLLLSTKWVFLIVIKNKENSNVKSILATSKFFRFPLISFAKNQIFLFLFGQFL